MKNVYVCKFGGSSLATAELVNHAIDIIQSDSRRKIVVCSAPGKKSMQDTKVTDLLIKIAEGDNSNAGYLREKLDELSNDVAEEVKPCYSLLENALLSQDDDRKERIAAFGEDFSAHLMAAMMRKRGINAVNIGQVIFGKKENGSFMPDPLCYENAGKMIKEKANGAIAVIPGFYVIADGKVRLLARGGSDTIGAAVANSVNASIYENWTDVDGLTRADPSIVKNPLIIPEITYEEVRELAYMNFKLQQDSMIPLEDKHIPLRVCNSQSPEKQGTLVVHDRIVPKGEVISGVAFKPGFIPLNIYKRFMNPEVNFSTKLYGGIGSHGVSYEHSATGIDRMSVIIGADQLEGVGKLNNMVRTLDDLVGPITAKAGKEMAMIGVVGMGMGSCINTDARVVCALNNAGIEIRMLNKGASAISMFIGVDPEKAKKGVNAIYNEFYGSGK